MKKNVFILLSFILGLLYSSNKAEAQTSKNKIANHSSISVLNGAWQTNWQGANNTASGTEYTVLHDGFFSNVGQDSTAAWRDTHAGTYEISGNIYKQKILYSSHPERMGMTHWIEFRIDGNNLYLNFFKKLIGSKGEDVTGQMHQYS